MSRLINYPETNVLEDNDIFILDGDDGTRIISAENLSKEIAEKSGLNDEIAELKDDLSENTYNLFNADKIEHYYISSTGEYNRAPYNASSDYMKIDSESEYSVSSNTIYGGVAFSWYDESKTFISRDNHYPAGIDFYTHQPPANAAYLRISLMYASVPTLTPEIIVSLETMVLEGNKNRDYLPFVTAKDYIARSEISTIPDVIYDKIYEQFGKVDIIENNSWKNGYVDPNGNEIVSSSTRCYGRKHHLVKTYPDSRKSVRIVCPATMKNRVTFWKADTYPVSGDNLIATYSNTNWSDGEQTYEIPANAVMFMVSIAFISNGSISPSDCSTVEVHQILEKQPIVSNYDGAIISILGDSISTFAGEDAQSAGDGHTIADGTYTYAGNHCRYPNAYLTSVSQTYWMKLITKLSARLGINDSWAGSCVSWNGSESSDAGADIYIASQTRIGHLDDHGTPDVILVNAGTNDIGRNVTVGTFNTESPASYTDEQIASLSVATFADAYRAMLIRLQKTYPLARIVVMLPNYTTSYYNPTNADRYLEIIKEACDYFGVPWIDMRTTGITMYNTGTYTGDGIHPNVGGMDLLFQKVLKAFLYEV